MTTAETLLDLDYDNADDNFLEKNGAAIAQAIAYEARANGRRRGV